VGVVTTRRLGTARARRALRVLRGRTTRTLGQLRRVLVQSALQGLTALRAATRRAGAGCVQQEASPLRAVGQIRLAQLAPAVDTVLLAADTAVGAECARRAAFL
jgi:hypothetical protein